MSITIEEKELVGLFAAIILAGVVAGSGAISSDADSLGEVVKQAKEILELARKQ